MENGSYTHSESLGNELIIHDEPARLFTLHGHSTNASAQYIQIHDAASTPADGAVPALVFEITANSNFALDIPDVGIDMDNGIYVCNSTTLATKTIGAADTFFTGVYK